MEKDDIITTHFEKGKTILTIFLTVKTNGKPIVHRGIYQGHDDMTLTLYDTTKKKMKYLTRRLISEITLEELGNTKNESLRIKLKELVGKFEILKPNKKINGLAKAYIINNIFSEKYIDDALHTAFASFYEINYLISWNFEHIVKVKTRRLVNSVNILNGLGEIEIISPQEL